MRNGSSLTPTIVPICARDPVPPADVQRRRKPGTLIGRQNLLYSGAGPGRPKAYRGCKWTTLLTNLDHAGYSKATDPRIFARNRQTLPVICATQSLA